MLGLESSPPRRDVGAWAYQQNVHMGLSQEQFRAYATGVNFNLGPAAILTGAFPERGLHDWESSARFRCLRLVRDTLQITTLRYGWDVLPPALQGFGSSRS